MRTRSFLLLSLLAFVAVPAHAVFPPKGFVIHEGSESPDRHYAILIPSAEAVGDGEPKEQPTRVVDLRSHTTVGTLKFSSYFEHANHRSLSFYWADDSTWCAMQSDGRFAFESLSIFQIERGSVRQTRIDQRVEEMLHRQLSGENGTDLDSTSVFMRPGLGKLRVRVLSDTNPKRFEDRETKCALFQGTYDLSAKKWTLTDVRSISEAQDDLLANAYQPLEQGGRIFHTESERAKWLDEQLNEVYGAIRLILPPTRFAAVKEEQLTWLKAQPKNDSAKQRNAAWTARIEVLEKLLW